MSPAGASEESRRSRLRAASVSEETRTDLPGCEGFRDLFYQRGLAPVEVMAVLGLSPENVGTLMRIHDVAGFEHVEVIDGRILSLMRELSDEEWAAVVQ